jgi:K+-transporting ATPase ATPase A chain
MTTLEIAQIALYLGLLIVCTPFLGRYMAAAFEGKQTFASPIFRPLERLTYRLTGVDEKVEMNWKTYLIVVLLFNLFGFLVVFLLQILQGVLPLNPQRLPDVEPYLAFNTAVSFMTNTNWQSYAGETTLSYLPQMLGLTVQNFVSAATGIAVLIALTRGIARRTASTIGNFWVDLTRATLYVLLPLAFVLALILVSQGVVQNFGEYRTVTTLTGEAQTLPQGPAASQIAIKQLGTNGGGFFNANSAHPYENPTPLSNFLQVFSILIIPAALTATYGIMVDSRRQGWVLFAAMFIMLIAGLGGMILSEYGAAGVLGATAMEGKEVRFGVANSLLWAEATTAASNGSVNAMHSSLTPVAGGIAMLNMALGEIIFGGVGSGLYGMLIFVMLTTFIAGLMVGRSPEYLGKKIEPLEVKMAILAVLLPSAAVLLFGMLAATTDVGKTSLASPGPHGLSEILYAFLSASNNNGSAFAGLNANVPFYNALLGLAMIIGRFGVIIPALVIAGSLAGKKYTPPSPGTFPTDGPLFVGLLIGVILIVGGLTFFPAFSLGPIVEQILFLTGRAF